MIKIIFKIAFFVLLLSKSSYASDFRNFEEINNKIPFIENINEYKSQLNNYYKSKNKSQINKNLQSSFEKFLPSNFHNKVNLGELIENKIDSNGLNTNTEASRLSVKEFISENPKYIYALDNFLRGPNTSIDTYTLQKSDVLLEAFNTFSRFPNIEKINSGRNISKIILPLTLATLVSKNFLEDDESCNDGEATITASADNIDENAGTAITLTATLSQTNTKDVTIDFTPSGTATEGTDYATISNITISAGSLTGTASLTPTDDSISEGISETVIPSFTSIEVCSGTSPTVSINDDDDLPVISLSTSATSIAENSGSSLTLTATTATVSSSDITVSLSTSSTATEGTDYSTISDITISAGDTTGTVSFTPTDDSMYETSTNETAIIAISSVSGGGAYENNTPQTVTITITENDSAPTVTLAGSASSIAENAGSSVTLTATLNNATSEDVTVTIGTSGAATEGTDYATISNITISAGDTTGTASFTPTNDSTYEGNEAAAVAITAVSGGSATESGTQSVSITITDDESAPTVTLSAASSSIYENAGTSVVLTATLSSATTADVTVSISTSGTGTEGTDYATVSDITISAGDTTGTANFTPTNDSGSEGNETAIIAISGVSGGSATESGTQSVTITIIDDESVPKATLAVSASSINENAGSSLTITATISSTSSSDVTVSISTSGAATEGTDYATISDITISAGDTTGTASFTPTDDSIYEDDEAAAVAISGVSGGNAIEDGTQSVSITISENESAPTVTLATSASSIAENAGSSLTLTATASGAADADITVSITPTGTGTEGTDYSTISDITISAGDTTGTVSFTPTNDSTYEGSETAIVAITGVSGGGASESGTQSTTITITDDESAPTVTLSAASSSIVENSGSAIVLTATLSSATTADVTVSISTSGAASEGSDYATISDITISAGSTTGTTNFTPTNDSTSEDTEAAVIAISGVSGGGASENGTQSVSINIVDDESAAAVTLTVSASSIAENAGSSITITATLSTTESADVTVTIGTSGTGTEGTDYEAVSNITISAGNTTGTASFTPTDDTTYEGNETGIIAITGVSGGNAYESGTQSQTITITENDSAPTVTLTRSAASIAENSTGTVTLTATLSIKTTAAVTVTLGSSGGTAGTDYVNLSTITVSAGSTTGTTTFNPTDDSVYEDDEAITITIDGVSGGSATESGNQSVIITISENESAPTVTLTSSASSVYDNGSDLTLTATASGAADADITVAITPTGTATEGTDYAEISNITISAGNTTGTTAFNPTSDSVNEGSETAIVAITGVTGGGASENGTQSVTITITEYALRTATAFADSGSDSVTAASVASNTQYSRIDTRDTGSTVHPYTQLGINKVAAFTDGTDYLTGKGEFIHIADFHCNTNLDLYDNKTIHNLDDGGSGESTFGNDTSDDYHCNAVATFAAADGSSYFRGVAPDADLVLSSIPNYNGTYATDDYARDLDIAGGTHGAVASNQSWGVSDGWNGSAFTSSYDASEFQSLVNQYPQFTLDQLGGFKLEGNAGLPSDQTAAFRQWIDAMDDFQSYGVMVWANGNYVNDSDASFLASLPQWFTELKGAWLSVMYADFTGADMTDIAESEFTRKGNPCGTAKEWCLTVDDFQLSHYTYYDENNGNQYGLTDTPTEGSGSSYGAPMVSGGIALLAQAFPNHTPEQLTSRVLASANNGWFTADGNTTFTTHGASITHGYNDTWGHGLPDFYAALSPITSNANPASIVVGSGEHTNLNSSSNSNSSSSQSARYAVSDSTIITSSSIGDALSVNLQNTEGYFYDALNGGFALDFSKLMDTKQIEQKSEQYNFGRDFARLQTFNDDMSFGTKYEFSGVLNYVDEFNPGLNITIESASAPLQYFNQFNAEKNLYLGAKSNPFTSKTKGLGFSDMTSIGSVDILMGYHNTRYTPNYKSVIPSETFASTFNFTDSGLDQLSIVTGVLKEKDTFIFSKGNGALNYDNSNPTSMFSGINIGHVFENDISLGFTGTLAHSEMQNSNLSLVGGSSNIISSSFNSTVSKKNAFRKNDRLSLSLAQPNKVESGNMTIRLPGLADTDGNLSYTESNISLRPSGRQIDVALDYVTSITDNFNIGIKTTINNDYNHIESNKVNGTIALSSALSW